MFEFVENSGTHTKLCPYSVHTFIFTSLQPKGHDGDFKLFGSVTRRHVGV